MNFTEDDYVPGQVEGSGDEPRLPGLFPTEREAEYWSQDGWFKETVIEVSYSLGVIFTF